MAKQIKRPYKVVAVNWLRSGKSVVKTFSSRTKALAEYAYCSTRLLDKGYNGAVVFETKSDDNVIETVEVRRGNSF